ncbi:MAG: hypothetical protein KKF68_03720 [Nanoarchaeota archaeon]|nr:hypothetical protein [Nanoarchaeota archaeon]
MKKKFSKLHVYSYLLAGTLFLIAGLRYAFVKDDIIGTIIYSISTLLFYFLALVYYKQLK